jgi:hypothetical protein
MALAAMTTSSPRRLYAPVPPPPAIDPPAAPRAGMIVFVLDPADDAPGATPLSHWALGAHHRVTRVNSRSFYTHVSGWLQGTPSHPERYLLVEWRHWLASRRAEGRVWIDRHPLRMPSLPGDPDMSKTEITIDVTARDQRYLRAAEDVIKRYTIDRAEDDDGVAVFTITGGQRVYTVQVLPDWSGNPTCTCPDAVHRAELTGGFCKHVIAVLLKHDDLRYQLLDVML